MKKLIGILILLILSTFLECKELLFKNNKFKILQFTDLHYHNNFQDMLTKTQQENLLQWENPDFVILTGDALTGDISVSIEEKWKLLTEPMKSKRIPW
jgi:predicted MPP superfamily phosphohydrolase